MWPFYSPKYHSFLFHTSLAPVLKHNVFCISLFLFHRTKVHSVAMAISITLKCIKKVIPGRNCKEICWMMGYIRFILIALTSYCLELCFWKEFQFLTTQMNDCGDCWMLITWITHRLLDKVRPVLFFYYKKCCFQACLWLKDEVEGTRKLIKSKIGASDSKVWMYNRLRPFHVIDGLCWVFVAKDADYNGLWSAVCLRRQLYFCKEEKGDQGRTFTAAFVASEDALPQHITVLEHSSYSVSPTVPFVISLPAGGASVA